MKTSEFRMWWKGLAQLSREQRERLRAWLQGESAGDAVVRWLEQSLPQPPACPH